MRKNIKKLIITLLLAVTVLNTTASSYGATTIPAKETITVPPLSFDEDFVEPPMPF